MENQNLQAFFPEWLEFSEEYFLDFDWESIFEYEECYDGFRCVSNGENKDFDGIAFEMNLWGEPDVSYEYLRRVEFLDKIELCPEDYAYLADRVPAEDDFFGEYNPTLQGRENRRDLAINWLVRKSHVPVRDNSKKDAKINITLEELISVLEAIKEKSLYHVIRKKKREGGVRLIYAPFADLKKVQKAINRLLRGLPQPEDAYGFSGGGIYEAVLPHVNSKLILTVDCKDAFPTVTREIIFKQLSRPRFSVPCVKDGKPAVRRVGYFSWYVAEIISRAGTFNGDMVQGPPTSPRLFDLCCEAMDHRLGELAKEYGGIYTRYADNILFSVNSKFFPDKLKNEILWAIQGRGLLNAVPFGYHKLKVRRTEKAVVRSLGLNIIKGEIHNLRSYKRKIRLTIHRLFWLIYHGRPEEIYDPIWNKLHGMMSFANWKTLPPDLIRQYKILEEALY